MFLLSHKTWHTGKAENIAKVRADEAAHAVELETQRQQSISAESEWRYQKLIEQSGGDIGSISRGDERRNRKSGRDGDDSKRDSKLAMFEKNGAALSDVLGDRQKPFYCETEYGTQKEKQSTVRRALEEEKNKPDSATEADVRRIIAQRRAERDEQRKQKLDPMLKVAQSLGDYSFLHPHGKESTERPSLQPSKEELSGSYEPPSKRSRKSHHHHSHHGHKHHHHGRKHRHHHHHSDDSSSSSDSEESDDADDDDDELRRLRAERLQRERRERTRTEQLVKTTLSSSSSATTSFVSSSNHRSFK